MRIEPSDLILAAVLLNLVAVGLVISRRQRSFFQKENAETELCKSQAALIGTLESNEKTLREIISAHERSISAQAEIIETLRERAWLIERQRDAGAPT